jgi:hypothetical protein
MKDWRFPETPFVEIASYYNSTVKQKLYHSDYEVAKKMTRDLINDTQLKATFVQEMQNLRKEMKKDISENQNGIRFIYEDIELKRKYDRVG